MPEIFEYQFSALGTRCSVRIAQSKRADADLVVCSIVDMVRAHEARWSRFRADSWISRLNASAGSGEWIETTPVEESLLDLYDHAFETSAGAIDPTVLALEPVWRGLPPGARPPEELLLRGRELTGWKKVERKPGAIRLPNPGMALDFGGLAKELLVDEAMHLALRAGISNVLVNFGGDVAVQGHPPGRQGWLIALTCPPHTVFAGAEHSNVGVMAAHGAIATSGDAARSLVAPDGKRKSHILDPRTGCPTQSPLIQATVLAETCLYAGFLATWCLLCENIGAAAAILAERGAPGLLFDHSGQTQMTGNLGRFLLPVRFGKDG